MSLIQTQNQAKPSSGSLPFLISELSKSGGSADKKFDVMIKDEMDRGELEIKFNAKKSDENVGSEKALANNDSISSNKKEEKLEQTKSENNNGEEKEDNQSPVSTAAQDESSEELNQDELKKAEGNEKPVKEDICAENQSSVEEITEDSLYLYMAMQLNQPTKLETAVLEEKVQPVEVNEEVLDEEVPTNLIENIRVDNRLQQTVQSSEIEQVVSDEILSGKTSIDDEVKSIGLIQGAMAASGVDLFKTDENKVEMNTAENELSTESLLKNVLSVDEPKVVNVLKDSEPVSVSAFSNGSEINFNLKINLEAILPQNTQRNMESLLEANFKVPVNELKPTESLGNHLPAFKSLSALNTTRPTVPVIKLMTVNPDSLQAQIRDTLTSELRLQGKDKIEIRLDPPEWGKVHVKIESLEAGLKVSFFSDNPLVRESLERHMSDLKAMLNQDGLNLSSLNVGVQDNAPKDQQREEGFLGGSMSDFEDGVSENETSAIKARERIKLTSVIDHVV